MWLCTVWMCACRGAAMADSSGWGLCVWGGGGGGSAIALCVLTYVGVGHGWSAEEGQP